MNVPDYELRESQLELTSISSRMSQFSISHVTGTSSVTVSNWLKWHSASESMLCHPVQVLVPFKLHPRALGQPSKRPYTPHSRGTCQEPGYRVLSAGKGDERNAGSFSLTAKLRAVDYCPSAVAIIQPYQYHLFYALICLFSSPLVVATFAWRIMNWILLPNLLMRLTVVIFCV